VRFTVRGSMVAVAVVALLIPFPYEAAIAMALVILLIWFPALLVEMMIFAFAGGKRAVGAVLAVSAVSIEGTVMLLLYRSPSFDAFDIVVCGLTPLNLIGPPYAVMRLRSGMRVVAGEALWAWLGLVWSVLLVGWHPHSSDEELRLLVQFCRTSLIMALLLALYGPRPVPPQSKWAHLIGWALMECNVVVWGWYAYRSRFWPLH